MDSDKGPKGRSRFQLVGISHLERLFIRGRRWRTLRSSGLPPSPEPNPYKEEWRHLVSAILLDNPYNEAVRGAQASLVTAMGRFAAHTGKAVTYDEMLVMPDDMTASVASMTANSVAPVLADANGVYPVPMPGKYRYEYRD